MITRTTLIIGLLLYLTSCSIYRTRITSNVDNSQNIELTKVNLLVEGDTKTIDFLESLANRIKIDLKRYDIETEITTKHPLGLKSAAGYQKEYEEMLSNFQPDVIFSIRLDETLSHYERSNVGNMRRTNQYSESDFIMEIGEPNAENLLWKAVMVLNVGGDFTRFSQQDTQKTSLKIIEKLQSDGILN